MIAGLLRIGRRSSSGDSDVSRVARRPSVIYTGKIRLAPPAFKDDVNEVRSGFEWRGQRLQLQRHQGWRSARMFPHAEDFAGGSDCLIFTGHATGGVFFYRFRRMMKMPIRSAHPWKFISPEGALAQRLKGKCSRSLKDRLRGKFNVGRGGNWKGQDSWQRSVVGVVSLANQCRIPRTILAHGPRGFRTASGPRFGRPRTGSPIGRICIQGLGKL